MNVPDDGCPDCLTHTPAYSVTEDGDWSLLALYRCPECGHEWPCWWDAISLARRVEAGAA